MPKTSTPRALLCATLLAVAAPAVAVAEQINLFMDGAKGDVLSLTHGGRVELARGPDGIAMLDADAVRDGLVISAVMRDASGAVVAIATEIENFPEGQKPGVEWDTYWTVVFPGRGSLYGFETEAIPEEHIPPFVQRAQGTAWTGEIRARIASGPRDDGWGSIVGGTGEFEGASGRFAEFYTLKELPVGGGILGILELEIDLDD